MKMILSDTINNWHSNKTPRYIFLASSFTAQKYLYFFLQTTKHSLHLEIINWEFLGIPWNLLTSEIDSFFPGQWKKTNFLIPQHFSFPFTTNLAYSSTFVPFKILMESPLSSSYYLQPLWSPTTKEKAEPTYTFFTGYIATALNLILCWTCHSLFYSPDKNLIAVLFNISKDELPLTKPSRYLYFPHTINPKFHLVKIKAWPQMDKMLRSLHSYKQNLVYQK